MPKTTDQITFTAPAEHIARINGIAKKKGVNRSWLTKVLIEFALDNLTNADINDIIKSDPKSKWRVIR